MSERRKYRVLAEPQSGLPTLESVTRRKVSRRIFRQLKSGGGPDEKKTLYVTLKAFDKTNGVTEWEYGPGVMWRHHYGANAITGIVPNPAATLNKYVVAASEAGAWSPAGNRNTSTLAANAAECFTLTKLNSLTGVVSESALMEGMFASVVTDGFASLIAGQTFREACALSGGNYVLVGDRVPVMEFENFTSNGTDKDYILHAHTQQGGNVYFRTRTSAEEIEVPYNSTASEVASLFAAATDCTAASATGGPWPHRKIELTCTWSAASGDIEAIKTDATFLSTVPGSGTSEWQFDAVEEVWNLIADNCTTGVATPPNYNPGFPATDFGTCEIAGVTNTAKGDAATYVPSTGLIANSVGKIFGASLEVTADKLIATGDTPPAVTVNAREGIFGIVAGPDDKVALCGTSSTYLECWTVAASWSNNWQKYDNTEGGITGVSESAGIGIFRLHVENSVVMVNFPNEDTGSGYVASATVAFSSGAVTELSSVAISTTSTDGDNRAFNLLHEGSSTTKTESDIAVTYRTIANPAFRKFAFNFEGQSVNVDGTRLLLGQLNVAAVDSDAVYGLSGTPSPFVNYGFVTISNLAGANARQYLWSFYLSPEQRFKAPTQWRLNFLAGSTSWLNWDATPAQIEAAVLAVYPENTGGIASNVQVNPLGAPAALDHAANLIERNLQIIFLGFSNATGRTQGYITPSHLTQGRVTISFQNVTEHQAAGIAAWDRTNGDSLWSRTWGIVFGGTATILYPNFLWSRGDYVYAYGPQLEAE